MNLQQTFKLSFIFLLVFIISSCGDSTDYTSESASSDAQIYGFKVACKPITSVDTVNYPIMAKTKFAIDQFKGLIYNPDSLPYKTALSKFATTIAFSSYGVSKVQLLYPKDSIATWESTSDSIDFSTHLYPKLVITAADGYTSKTYNVDIRIHKVDPDLMVWEDVSEQVKQPTSINKQKTLLKDDVFYTFSVDTDSKLYLHKANKGTAYNSKTALSGTLPAANKFDLQSITLLNGSFYAIDTDKKSYSSADGITWNKKSNTIYNIIGVLPSTEEAKDSLLVITENAGIYTFAKTIDMETLKPIRTFNAIEKERFPVSGFSATTNFDRNNLNKNLLILTGGVDSNNKNRNQTWLIQVADNNSIRLIVNDEHNAFSSTDGIVNFMYNSNLYVLTSNKLYKSISFGSRWSLAPESETLAPEIPKASAQTVIVDEENYIWIFGGIPANSSDGPIHKVWRGRLNKLNPKK